jgi:hypothetical protein
MFSRSWRLLQATWSLLRSDKELTAFPALSGVLVFIVSIVFFGIFAVILLSNPEIARAITTDSRLNEGDVPSSVYVLGFLWTFAYYFVISVITTYLSSALIGAVLMRLDGKDPTLADGFSIARTRLNSIVGYSLIAATVGTILNMIRDNRNVGIGSIVRAIFADLAEAAWNIITFLAVPVLVAEGVGPVDAIKRSFQLLKKTFGEQIIGGVGLGLIMGLFGFLIILITGLIASLVGSMRFALGVFIVIILGIVALATLSVISSALGGIFKAVVYHYAQTGEIPEGFGDDLVRGAFKPKRGALPV